MKTILLVDDDIDLCRSLESFLKCYHFAVYVANESDLAEEVIKNKEIDLILLDLLLPGAKNGIALCKTIRETSNVPIIILTGVEEDIECILSLEIGADDYLIKPVNTRVLIAHINAVLRRSLLTASTVVDINEFDVFEFSGWKLNVTSRILLSSENKIVKLTSAEFSLLHILLSNPQRIFSRDKLIDATNSGSVAFDRSIDILMSRLRNKIEKKNASQKIFVTIRNGGYLLSCKVKRTKIKSDCWEKFLFKS